MNHSRLFIVWGTGPAASPLIREAEAAGPAAWTVALLKGAPDPATDPDAWCVAVDATESDLDAATRFDSAVRGYLMFDPKWSAN